MAEIDNIEVHQGTHFNICYGPPWGCNCAVILLHHQDKNKHVWKLPYSWQLKCNKAENVVALPPNQDSVSGLVVAFFLILQLTSHTFVPTPFHHLIPEPSCLQFLLTHIPKYQNLFLYIISFIFRWPNPELQAPFLFSSHLAICWWLYCCPTYHCIQLHKALTLVKKT